MDDSIILGHVVKPFGIKGGVFVFMLNDESDTLVVGKHVVLKKPRQPDRTVTVSEIMDGGRVFFSEVTDRDAADELRGSELWMDRADFPALADDEYYLTDLAGARVYDVGMNFVGEIVGFSSNGPQTLFEIMTTSGHQASVPSVKPIIQKIDFVEKLVVIDPPAGLLDPMD